ncbi:MAG TPA: hypothetical protein VF763_10265 [Candidatus Limnocylindrales bacterium]
MQYLLGLFLAAHGLIHASYLSRVPPDAGWNWPFDMSRSWLVASLGLDTGLVRVLGIVLIAITVVGYLVAAAAAVGLAGSLWQPAVVLASVASVALLVLCFHPWIVLGFAIDAVLLWAVLAAAFHPSSLLGR